MEDSCRSFVFLVTRGMPAGQPDGCNIASRLLVQEIHCGKYVWFMWLQGYSGLNMVSIILEVFPAYFVALSGDIFWISGSPLSQQSPKVGQRFWEDPGGHKSSILYPSTVIAGHVV